MKTIIEGKLSNSENKVTDFVDRFNQNFRELFGQERVKLRNESNYILYELIHIILDNDDFYAEDGQLIEVLVESSEIEIFFKVRCLIDDLNFDHIALIDPEISEKLILVDSQKLIAELCSEVLFLEENKEIKIRKEIR